MTLDIRIDEEFRSLIPPLSDEERTQLEANLVADGCRDPLVVWRSDDGDVLIDGHNRHEICSRLGIEFEVVHLSFVSRDAVADWIDANQLGRRNLSPDLASMLRGRRYCRARQAHGGDRKSGSSAQSEHLKTADKLAGEHGVSPATIRRDGKRFEALEKLKATNPDAAADVLSGKKRFNEVRREIKRVEVKETATLPDAKYRVIYADPPWKYGDQLTEDYGPTKFHYPSMTIGELCAMPVKSLTLDDAVLFMWVTSPLLYEAEPIISAWGFEYKTSFVWDKVKHNMGHYNSVRHELLLVCTRGSCLPDESKLFDSVQSIERTKHSAKPKEFRDIIETLYPHGKKLELFAREQVAGWESYGNQL